DPGGDNRGGAQRDARGVRSRSAGRCTCAGARSGVSLSWIADVVRSLPDPYRWSADRTAAGVLDAGGDGAGAGRAGRAAHRAGDRVLRDALDVSGLLVQPDIVQCRNATSTAFLVLFDDRAG